MTEYVTRFNKATGRYQLQHYRGGPFFDDAISFKAPPKEAHRKAEGRDHIFTDATTAPPAKEGAGIKKPDKTHGDEIIERLKNLNNNHSKLKSIIAKASKPVVGTGLPEL